MSFIQNEAAYEAAKAARIKENARIGRGKRWVAGEAGREELSERLMAFHGTKGFMGKMAEALVEWGSLTPGQEAAVRKSLSQIAERRAMYAAEAALSEYVGEVGKREVFELVCQSVIRLEGADGEAFYINAFKSGENQVVYCGKKLPVEKGGVYKIKATVKCHGEYRGAKQTKISRPVMQ